MNRVERLRRALDAARQRLRALNDITDRDLTAEETAEFRALSGEAGTAGSVRQIAADFADAERAQADLDDAADQVIRADDTARAARLAASAVEQGTTGVVEQPGQVPRAAGGAMVTDPEVYARGGQRSYFRDMMAVGMNQPGVRDAQEQLERSRRQTADQLRQRSRTGDQMAARALTTVDGAGGDFVPPVWMVDEFIGLARAARVTADLVNHQPLPPGTDSINLPRLATGTAVAEQATQNTAVQNTDATTNAVTAAVTTIAGQQVVAVQLLEQSPINMDDVLLADLAADYATKVDIFTLSNNVAGKIGILNVASVNTGAVTATTITGAGSLYGQIANGVQLVQTTRFLPPDGIVMHPRRWAALLAAADSTGRPLIVPDAGQGALNALAVSAGVVSQQRVGTIQGLPVYTDPNLPTNLGAGTNQDPVIVARFADLWLYEGTQRSEAFRETKADQLSVLLRFYNYVAFQGGRFPKSIALLTGVGLVPPTF